MRNEVVLCKKKKGIVKAGFALTSVLCPGIFGYFCGAFFFLQTGVSLRKPENLIFHSKGTLACFHTHM